MFIRRTKEVSNLKQRPRKLAFALSRFSTQDRLAHRLIQFVSLSVIAVLVIMIIRLFFAAKLSFDTFGLEFIINSSWNPIEDDMGALPFIFGTVVTSAVALIIAGPISVYIALYITEYLPKSISGVLSLFVELIAAIPSIIFGLWGLYYLAPWIKTDLTPILKNSFGFLPLFKGPSFGIGILAASVILALMIIPTITSICRELFNSVSNYQKEAAMALGATKYETIKIAILKPSFSGIMGALVLGLGRALGETMAVAMVIGNNPTITASLFSPAATMASVMANEYAEAESKLHLSSLCYIGLLLFIITFIINILARGIIWKNTQRIKRK